MLSEYLAVAIRNSRLYGEVEETKRSLEQLVRSAGDGIISVDGRPHPGLEPGGGAHLRRAREAVGRPLTSSCPRSPTGSGRASLSKVESVRSFDVTTKRDDGRL